MINFQPANPQEQPQLAVNPANLRRRRALAEALAASAPKTVQNTGQGLAMMGMQAAGGFLDGMNERREQQAEQQRRLATADALVGSFGDKLPGNMNREQFRNFALGNPEMAAKMGIEMLQSQLRPQERFVDETIDGRRVQRSRLTNEIKVVPSDLLTPEVEAQKKRLQPNQFADRAAGNMANRFDKLATSAQAAAGNAGNFQMLRELNKLAPTGPLQGRLAELMPNATTAGAAFTAIVNQIAPTLRVEGSGATSDMEMNLFMQSLPRLRNTPQTNEALIGFMERKAQLDVQRGTLAQRALRGEMSSADAERELEKLNSVSLLTPEIRTALGIPEPQPQGGQPPPAPVQGQPQGQPQPQQAPQQAETMIEIPGIGPVPLSAAQAEMERQMQQQRQSQMGVSP
jgi:hypothetical protein